MQKALKKKKRKYVKCGLIFRIFPQIRRAPNITCVRFVCVLRYSFQLYLTLSQNEF